jgi:NAD(P)-dependent dehydrogenase (short-subunit alcohol dehydrogenase family)
MLTKSILITGGTSGLGKELVKLFLKSGNFVVTTGRQSLEMSGYEDKFKLIQVDFSDLKQTAITFGQLCENYSFDLVINNAGILSPPRITKTTDGLEYTFQVNFLSHLLINEIILNNHETGKPVIIASITSPVYRLVTRNLSFRQDEKNYASFKNYSESKLFLALMCKYLPVKYADLDLKCIGFDPGVFSSGIFRMRAPVFRFLYRIAAPFMRSPEKVARVLAGLLMSTELINGSIYDFTKRSKQIPGIDAAAEARFWGDCDKLLGQYLNS